MRPAANQNARPFIKWAGGKGQLLAQLEPLFPGQFARYIEPFVGSGAVFFHLWNQKRLTGQAFLYDNNEELVHAYRMVRDRLDELVECLSVYQATHNPDTYYKIRNLDRQETKLGNPERAARTIYLNHTCYNGLYRVNGKGQFNVPMGRYKNPAILNRSVLHSASEALQNVSIEAKDFREMVDVARQGDFFYFDPPYDPVSQTANFTSYTAGNFDAKDQKELAEVYARLTELGCRCMLSNSYTPFIMDLYSKFRIETVYARRAVNSKADRRGIIKEVVVLNYQNQA